MSEYTDQVTLLHLSDLHIISDFPEQEESRKYFLNFVKERVVEWKVDYVVITGDIMHYSNNSNYGLAHDFIDRLLDVLHLGKDTLFVIPGNHDKSIKDLLPKRKKETTAEADMRREKTENEREDVKGVLSGKKDKRILLRRFNTYLKFAGNYNTDMEPLTFFNRVSPVPVGVCVRKKHKICFVLLNTEWSYLNPSDQSNMVIGNSLVKEIKNILHRYEDYRVITLIHRSFRQLDWEEVYSEEEKKSSMDMIIDFSKLILAGHGHTKSSGIPDFLQNKTQILEGGAFGALPDKNKHVYKAQANLLKLDFAKGILNIVNLLYDYTGKNKWRNKWEETKERTYWLNSYLYPIKKEEEENPEKYQVEQYPVISLIRDTREEIEKAILRRIFDQDKAPEGIDAIFCHLLDMPSKLENDKVKYIIFYAFLNRGLNKERMVQLFLDNRKRVFEMYDTDRDGCVLVFLE